MKKRNYIVKALFSMMLLFMSAWMISVTSRAETVEENGTITVKAVPSTISVAFFTDEDAQNALPEDAIVDQGEQGKYHQYTLKLSEGTYYYRGTDGTDFIGGGSFTADGTDTSYTLVRTNLYVNSNAFAEVGDYWITKMQRQTDQEDMVEGTAYINGGKLYTPYLLLAGASGNTSYSWDYELAEEKLEDYYKGTVSNISISATATAAKTQTISATLYKKITLTAPSDASVAFFKQNKNFNVSPVAPVIGEDSMDKVTYNGDGTTTYLFKAKSAHSNHSYRVSASGEITQAGYLADGADVTVTFPEDGRGRTSQESTLDYDDRNVLLNINEKNKLSMSVGDSFKLRAYRAAWQIINTTTANVMIEPDFHYDILEGEDVISIKPTKVSEVSGSCNGNATGNWMQVNALKEGTAVVAVYYDAIDVYGANPANATGITKFGATDPARYGIFVVNVGKDADITWNPVSADGDWDSEFDTVYYTGDQGSFTFVPDQNVQRVTVQNVYGRKMKAIVSANTAKDGSVTVPVKEGANIVAFHTADGTDYRVVKARKINYEITNNTTGEKEVNGAPAISKGDQVTIDLGKLDMPMPKFSGIYNPGYMGTAKAVFTLNDSMLLASAGTQYDFSSNHSITFTAHQPGTNHLEGHISFSNYGSDPGDHRDVTDQGVPANMNAGEKYWDSSIFPEITFEVTDNETPVSYEDAVKVKSISIKGANSTKYMLGFTEWKKLEDGNTNWTANAATVAPYNLYATVNMTDYNNSIKLRYWYDGEEPRTTVLKSGITKTLSQEELPMDANRILNLELIITPIGTEKKDPVIYHYIVYPGQSNLTFIHPVITDLKAVVGVDEQGEPIISNVTSDQGSGVNTATTQYRLDVNKAEKIDLDATMLQKVKKDSENTQDKADTVMIQKMYRGNAVGELIKVYPLSEERYPTGSWSLKDLDITDTDCLQIKVTSYVDEETEHPTSRTYKVKLVNTKKDAAAAQAVADQIAAIGTITLDSKEAIDAARKAYEALTEEQKMIVPQESLIALEEAEKLYNAKKAADDQRKAEEAAKKAEEAKKNAAKKQTVKGLKLKSRRRKITVTWKKNKKVSGYQVVYKQKKAKKYKKLKLTKKTKVTTKKLKKGKYYQFKVRPYTTIAGRKIYGKWTKVKKVKCR